MPCTSTYRISWSGSIVSRLTESVLGNGFVYYGLDNGEKTFYGLAQKMVSGALSAYAGVNAFGKVPFYKADGVNYFGGSKTFAKAWRAGWYNVASDWAHTSQYDWNKRDFKFGASLGAFGGGFLGGAMSAIGMHYQDDVVRKDKILAGMYAVGVNYLAGGAEYFIQQQALSKQQAFGYSYTPWAYQFRHRKMAIWSYKSLMYGFTGKIAK